jgi:hypothetical protein
MDSDDLAFAIPVVCIGTMILYHTEVWTGHNDSW